MSVEFQDYYEVLHVPRTASQKEIQKSYRRLARTYHPDINKEKSAEEQFKKITEAYEVLKNPEARKRYDMLGSNYKSGQPFTPPGSWQNIHVDFGDLGGSGSNFSSFFEQFFGDGLGRRQRSTRSSWSNTRNPEPVVDQVATIEISLEEAMQGLEKEILIQDPHESEARSLRIKIPPGATEGARIRLRGQGTNKGDLVLHIIIKPHPLFRLKKRDLFMRLALSPWEAALGASIKISSLGNSKIIMKVPPATQSGGQLRLRGKGLPSKNGPAGDLLVEVRIVVPTTLSTQERSLFEKLKEISTFNPRNS